MTTKAKYNALSEKKEIEDFCFIIFLNNKLNRIKSDINKGFIKGNDETINQIECLLKEEDISIALSLEIEQERFSKWLAKELVDNLSFLKDIYRRQMEEIFLIEELP